MPQYDLDSNITNTLSNATKSFSISEVWIIVSILLAVIGGIFLYTNYFNKDKEKEYTGLKKKLYDFLNFKITIIEPIFRITYLIIALAITLCSFSYLTENFFKFIGLLVFGNLMARISFELLLLTLKLIKDVSEINLKLNKKDNEKVKKSTKKEIEEISE